MRQFQFKFCKGTVVKIADGLGFASPQPKERQYEKVVVIGHSRQRQFDAQWNSYLVKSIDHPEETYWVQESFLVQTKRR